MEGLGLSGAHQHITWTGREGKLEQDSNTVSLSQPAQSELEKRQPSLAKLRQNLVWSLVLVVSVESVAQLSETETEPSAIGYIL